MYASDFNQSLVPENWFDYTLTPTSWFSSSLPAGNGVVEGTVYSYTGTGVSTTAGLSTYAHSLVYAASGALTADSASGYLRTTVIFGAGSSLTLSSTVAYTRVLKYAVSSELTIVGNTEYSFASIAVYTYLGTGVVEFASQTPISITKLYVGAGELTLQNSEGYAQSRVVAGTGTIEIEGTTGVARRASVSGDGSLTITSTSNVTNIHAVIAQGGILAASGALVRFLRYIARPIVYTHINKHNNVEFVDTPNDLRLRPTKLTVVPAEQNDADVIVAHNNLIVK